MTRIPQRVATSDPFSTSTPLTTTTSNNGGTTGVGVGVTTVNGVVMSRVHHQSGFSYDNIYEFPGADWDYMNGLDLASYAAETQIAGVLNASTDYIAREFLTAALYINANGNTGSMSVAAYDEQGTFISRSQSKAFDATYNDYLVIDWKHNLTIGVGDLYYFRIELEESISLYPFFVDPQPFFAFHGAATTTTGGGGGGGSPSTGGTTDLRNLYLSRYTHGAAEVIVDGTSIQDAIDSMPTDGGKILVKNGTYAPFSFVNKSFTAYCSVMNFPGHSPHVSGLEGLDAQNLERACLILDSDHIGVFGLEMSSINASGHPYADVMAVGNSHHIAVWANNIHDGASGTGGVDSNHYDICYNRVYNCAGWLETFASGISLYQLEDIGGGVDSDGYSARIIGNICYNNFNDPSFSGITDGNGIIVDVANNTGYTGRVLVANNICVNNGGRGVHAFVSDNVDQWFNTSALNLRSATMTNDGEIAQVFSSNGNTAYNVVQTASNRNNWFYSDTLSAETNVIVGGSLPAISGTNIDRTASGSAYFINPSTANPTAAGWKPSSPDYVTVDSAARTALATWPDAAGFLRPNSPTWTAGAVEVATSGGGNGGGTVGAGVPTPPVPPLYYPEDFGAVGNGIADDTSALQDCLDSLGGGTMVLTPGKIYNHSSVLHVNSGNINGGGYRSGTSVVNCGVLHATDQANSAVWFSGPGTSAYGVKFTCNATSRYLTYDQMKVRIHSSGQVFHEVEVDGSAAIGLFMEAEDYTLRSCVVRNTKADSIHSTSGSTRGLITDPYIENSGDDCVAVVSYNDLCNNITILRPVARGGRARGVTVVGGESITIRDIDIQGTDYAGIYISSEFEYNTREVQTVVVSGGTVTGCAANSGHPSILLYNSNSYIDDVLIENIHVYDTAGSGSNHIAAYDAPITNCRLNSILVHAAPRSSLVYDPDNALTITGVAYA